jgi:hypothetical protein
MFRWGGEYQPAAGAFRFRQSKTDSYVSVEVSEPLKGLSLAVHDPESPYLFVDRKTGKPFAEQRLGHVWEAIRKAAGLDERLQIRTLRHSCVVQLARASCTVPEIASITGHSPFSAEQILAKYLPRDSEVARNAQRKRGLIGPKLEQKSDDQSDGASDGRSGGGETASRIRVKSAS